MMLGIHSKIVFSSFAASKLKIKEENRERKFKSISMELSLQQAQKL